MRLMQKTVETPKIKWVAMRLEESGVISLSVGIKPTVEIYVTIAMDRK